MSPRWLSVSRKRIGSLWEGASFLLMKVSHSPSRHNPKRIKGSPPLRVPFTSSENALGRVIATAVAHSHPGDLPQGGVWRPTCSQEGKPNCDLRQSFCSKTKIHGFPFLLGHFVLCSVLTLFHFASPLARTFCLQVHNNRLKSSLAGGNDRESWHKRRVSEHFPGSLTSPVIETSNSITIKK